MNDIVVILKEQAKEIAEQGIPGWGNTMLWAAEEIERLRQEAANKLMQPTPKAGG